MEASDVLQPAPPAPVEPTPVPPVPPVPSAETRVVDAVEPVVAELEGEVRQGEKAMHDFYTQVRTEVSTYVEHVRENGAKHLEQILG